MSRQVEAAVARADVVLFVVDAAVGVTDDDDAIADWLRTDRPPTCSSSPTRPTTTAARPSAGSSWRSASASRSRSARCTAGAPATCSTRSSPASRRRRAERASRSTSRRRRAEQPWTPDDPAPPRVAIVGRPNVGKSTLFNRLVGEDRSVVHDMPGTTRDAIDTLVETDGRARSCSSTPPACAGAARIDDSAEYYSLVRALRAIDDADIALLVIDATEGVTGQDQRLAERIDAAGCPIVVMLNKWELIDDAERAARRSTADVAAQAGLHRRRPGAEDLGAHRQGRAQAAAGAAGGDRAVPPAGADPRRQPGDRRRAAAPAGRRRDRRCCTRCRARPIRRRSRCSPTASCPPTYLRYLERSIREAFEFGSTPLKLRVRKRTE